MSAVDEVLGVIQKDLSAGGTLIQNQLSNTALGRVVNSTLDVISPGTAPRTVSSQQDATNSMIYLIVGGIVVYFLIKKR